MSTTTFDSPIELVLSKFENAKKSGKEWSVRCPSHEDRTASLCITEGDDGKVILRCHAGCTFKSIVAAMGLQERDMFPPRQNNSFSAPDQVIARYVYCGPTGEALARKCRKQPKSFFWQHPNPNRPNQKQIREQDWIGGRGGQVPLYNQPGILNLREDDPDQIVLVVEGEKDADNVNNLGLTATTSPDGASKDAQRPKWCNGYTEALRGLNICVLCDNDDAGHAHGENIARCLQGVATSVRLILAMPQNGPKKVKDVSDWIENITTNDADVQLRAMISAAPIWTNAPDAAPADSPLPSSANDRATEMANAEQLHRLYGKYIKFNTDRGEFFLWTGKHCSGANGKSVIFETIMSMLGPLASIAPESLLVSRNGQTEHPTEIADLLGKRLVVASETESGATLRLQLIKRLTGDSVIKGRRMRQDFFEFRRTHKLVLVTNSKPRISEDTEAVWRRVRLLPFDVVIPPSERDPELLAKLRNEWSGILAWCVRGGLDLQQNTMNTPAEVMAATNEYREDADELADFIASKCILGDSSFRVTRSDLFAAYDAWAAATHQRHRLERDQFYESIRRRQGIGDGKWKASGNTVRGFTGIGLAYGGE